MPKKIFLAHFKMYKISIFVKYVQISNFQKMPKIVENTF